MTITSYMEEREKVRGTRYERPRTCKVRMRSLKGIDCSFVEGHEGHAPIPRCVVGALLSDGKVLLVKRSPQRQFYPNVWDLFGGHVEEGESPEDASRREALEELQVEIESPRFLGTVHDPVEPADIMVSAVSAWKGEPINAAPDEHADIGWFPADGLPVSAALDAYRELILRAMAGSTVGFPGEPN